MKPSKYISEKNLPPRIPLLSGIIWWLLLDSLGAPIWTMWVLAGIMFIYSAIVVAKLMTGKEVDIFPDA